MGGWVGVVIPIKVVTDVFLTPFVFRLYSLSLSFSPLSPLHRRISVSLVMQAHAHTHTHTYTHAHTRTHSTHTHSRVLCLLIFISLRSFRLCYSMTMFMSILPLPPLFSAALAFKAVHAGQAHQKRFTEGETALCFSPSLSLSLLLLLLITASSSSALRSPA